MFFIRLLLLLLLFFYGLAMVPSPMYQLNAFGKLGVFVFFIAAPCLYLLPTYEAWKNQHSNLASIALVNIFLGWSLLGWVDAVVWAYKKPEQILSIAEPVALEVVTAQPQAHELKKLSFLRRRCTCSGN